MSGSKPNLTERAEMLLKTLVEKYIEDGQPVGSRTLSRAIPQSLSPATIRNVMSDLEELGLIHSPHTSAGRVPTQEGYRLFVDSLLHVDVANPGFVRELEQELTREVDPNKLSAAASELLSRFTKLAGVVVTPKRETAKFHQLEYLALDNERVLVILVTEDGRVQNRVIQTDKAYSPSELVEAANFFNQRYSHIPLSDVKRLLLREMQQDRDEMNRLMDMTMRMAAAVFQAETDDDTDVLVSGESNLFDMPDLHNIEKLRDLLDVLKKKQDLLMLLDKSMRADGIQIFFGEDSGYKALSGCSVVTTSYGSGGQVLGTLGVIGPARIPYNEIIPVVDVTARLLGKALSRQLN